MTWTLAGLAFGFFGSLHCVGMCGPLALSLPGSQQQRTRFLAERLLYNLGRVITYTALGGVVGTASGLLSWAGAQKALSVGVGVVLLLVAAVPWVSRQARRLEQLPSSFLRPVLASVQAFYRRSGAGSLLFVGLLNGLLPCGFVYAALATALTAGTPAASMRFMAGFGLGTVPAMFGVSLLGRLANPVWRRRLHRFAPVALGLVGVLLIVRGLGLGSMWSPLLSASRL